MTVWLVISVDGWRLGYGGRRVRTIQEAVWFATEEAAAAECGQFDRVWPYVVE